MTSLLPHLKAGQVFQHRDESTVNNVASSFMKMAGMKSKTDVMENVILTISDDLTKFEWKNLENVQNQPKSKGYVSLLNVQVVRPTSAAEGMSIGFALCDARANVLLILGCDSIEIRDIWIKTIGEAAYCLRDRVSEIENKSKTRNEKLHQLEERQKHRDELKASMGLNGIGMSNTAKIMAERA